MDHQTVVGWEIPLQGADADLEVLVAALSARDVRVARHEEGFVLSIPATVIGPEYGPVREYAEEHLAGINGIGKLLDPAFQAVRLSTNPFGIDASGRRVRTVLALEGIDLRIRGGAIGFLINGVRQPDPRTVGGFALLDGASKSQLAWDALAIVGHNSPTWAELYLAYELVKTGTHDNICRACDATELEIDLFTHTANSYAALGRQGRHGTTNIAPPAVPMGLPEATTFVRRLVEKWLRRLAL